MELDRKNVRKILGIVAFGILLSWALQNLPVFGAGVAFVLRLLLPFTAGACMAFILCVPLRFIENRLFGLLNRKCKRIWPKLRRPASMLLSYAFLFGIVLFVIFLVIPELVRTLKTLAETAPGAVAGLQRMLNNLIGQYPQLSDWLGSLQLDWGRIGATIADFLQSSVTRVLSSTVSVASSVIGGVVNFILAFTFSIYVVHQKERLGSQAKRLLYAYLPEARSDRIIEILSLSHKTFSNFITGQFTEAIILGALCFVGMSIFRFPYALMISVLVGFTALIPIVGAFIGTIVGALLIVTASPIQALWFILFILVLQQIEGNLIYPRVVGTSVGLPGIWVLVAVTAGGSLYGIVGMLFSVPVSSVLYCLLRETVRRRVKERGIEREKWA